VVGMISTISSLQQQAHWQY